MASVPNFVIVVDDKGRMRPKVDGKFIVGVVKVDVEGWPEGIVTLQILGRFVSYEREADASR
jgi:hypothetical protein